MSSVWVCSVKKNLHNGPCDCSCYDNENGKKWCDEMYRPCDAVEYAPVVGGRWEHDKYSPKPDSKMYYNGEMWKCSCCFNKRAFKSNYCPSCGAKMEEQ